MAGAVRLGNVICKMQLAHACLGQGCLLTEPMNSSYLDYALLTMLISYLLAVLWSVSSSIMNIILALVALAGSTWALLKAIQTIRALEKKLKTLEVNADFVSEVPSLKLITWKALISAGRGNDDIHDLLSKTAKESETEGHGLGSYMEDVKDMNIRDTFWHGRTIFHLTGSRAGFLVLPSFVAMVMASMIITASQVTVYACSRGQLSNLQLASSPSLEFHPWQTRYEVLVDTSFRQVTMVASSDPSTTQWINYTQPNTSTPMQIQMTDNSSGSMVAEIHLSPRHVPRISHIYVKGLRVSLDPVEYQVRFSPLMTLPTTVKITAQDFETKLAWSALPGSIISVPAGSDDFMIEVTLTDFVFNFPRKAEEYEDQGQELWTTFEELNSINETTCRSKCHNKLHCFNYFVSDAGCFFIEGNTTKLENHISNISSISWSSRSSSLYSSRQISGEFVGCRQTSETSGRCPNGKDLNGLLRFEGISPDWRGSLANLGFALNLDVGGQHFAAESQLIQLRRGIPFANDVIGCLLAEDNDHRIKIIETNLWIDSGNVVVNVSKFDPENITALKLSVMPLLPDPAFVVQWEVNTTLEMPADFAIYTKCNESPLLSERYTLCGATSGIGIDAKPITITVDPWSGRPESFLRFTVVPKSLEVKDEKAPLAEHMVRMNFQVDSPAAWAAEYHNCTLLKRNVSVEKSLLESADATCQLLRSCSEETLAKLCELITRNGLGGRERYFKAKRKYEHVPALLPPQGVLKVLACLKDVGHDACTMPTAWDHDSTGILHLQKHSAKVPVKFVVAQLEEMDETKGSAWLHAMNVTSDSQGAQSKDDPALFDQELAKAALEVGQITALPKVLRILGRWKLGMPQILLDALAASHRMDLMQLMELTPEHSLSDTFSGIKALTAALDDASDLCFVSLALNLAENLEELKVSCFRCNDFAKVPAAEAWKHLSSQVAKIEHLTLDHFIVTDPGLVVHHSKSLKSLSLQHNQITTLPNKVFSGLFNLKRLDLENNKLTELPQEVFSGLSKLEILSLQYNKLTELPKKVFSGLFNLETLNLGANHITTLPKEVFSGLSKLKAVYLMENKLTELPKEVFSGLSNLKKLNLYGNHLYEDDIPGFSNLTARGVDVRVYYR